MLGWLIINAYLKKQKFNELFAMLEEAADELEIKLKIMTNEESWLYFAKDEREEKPDFILFWDKDIRLAQMFEKNGFRVFNSAEGISVCDDKSKTFFALYDSGIRMPRTIVAPKIFQPEGFSETTFFEEVAKEWGYPLIFKECNGSFGAQVYLVHDQEEMIKVIKHIGNRPFLIQEYIETSYGRDVRIQVVGGKVVASMLRTNENDFRANITNGGSMQSYTPTKEQEEMAIQVCEKLKLDFAGVDIMFGNEGEPVLCEVNSNAHFKNLYDCTGVNTAKEILKYIKEKMKERGNVIHFQKK